MIQFKVGDVAWAKVAPDPVHWQVINLEGVERVTVTFKYLQMDNDYTWEYLYNSAEGVAPGWGIIRAGKVIQ
jgi:hypothetical protein